MSLRVIFNVWISLYLFFSPALTKVPHEKAAFDVQAALNHISDLSSEAMQGRKSGLPGGRMAAQYIASKFREWGIEPAISGGSYFQNLTLEFSNIEQGPALEIFTEEASKKFDYSEDWRIERTSGSGNRIADMIFVGYGISAPQAGYDDYAGVDVKGKLVLFSMDAPRRLAEKLRKEAVIDQRIKAAQDHGAVGILLFRNSEGRSSDFAYRRGIRPNKESFKKDFVILSVESKIMNFIFKDLQTDLRYLQQQVESTGQPQSYDLKAKAYIRVRVTRDEKRETENVLAKITGTDKALRNEYVLIGAHMDHLGIDPMGDVNNGANDNASGTAVVMEIARMMKNNRIQPKRTVVFALWAGEEQGLVGSRFYTENPPYPLERAVVYINMDMVGHGSGRVNFSGIYYAPEIWELLQARLPKEIAENVRPGRGGPGGSDHTPFLFKGIPAFFVMTEGFHFKYHQPGDDMVLINPQALKNVGDFVSAAVEILASEPKNLIQMGRQKNYWWRYATVINFESPPVERVAEEHGKAHAPEVDIQMAVLPEKEGLSGDALRVHIITNLLSAQEKVRTSPNLVLFASSGQVSGNMRQGKVTVLVGLRGMNSFRDDPRWAEVLVKQGVSFVWLENPSFLFGSKGLSEEGIKAVDALNKTNLLLLIRGFELAQVKTFLEHYQKPFLLVAESLPDQDIIERIQKTDSALGLLLGKDEAAAAYFKRLDDAKKALGIEHLILINENCLWGMKGKDQMKEVIAEMLKANYENTDITGLFSDTFLRILSQARGEDDSQRARSPYIPF
ncbi:MAG: M28 family peptidase [Candidatus Aminicenantales bacterium]